VNIQPTNNEHDDDEKKINKINARKQQTHKPQLQKHSNENTHQYKANNNFSLPLSTFLYIIFLHVYFPINASKKVNG
jgi:hypothetical protein